MFWPSPRGSDPFSDKASITLPDRVGDVAIIRVSAGYSETSRYGEAGIVVLTQHCDVDFRDQSTCVDVRKQPMELSVMAVLQNHQVNILVVDPDAESRGRIHELLMADGYASRAVGTASAAIQSAEEKIPQLLICDVNLGDQSGLALFAQLKTSIDCPVVFISDSRKPETMKHAHRAGATYFLSKPLDPAVLMELIDKALWMPHLVRRHIDSVAHQLKAPTFSPFSTRARS